MASAFTPGTWYYRTASDPGNVVSAQRGVVVPTTDESYAAWVADGNKATTVDNYPDLYTYLSTRAPDSAAALAVALLGGAPVPQEVTNWQACAVLLETPATDGSSANMFVQVDTAIQGMKATNALAWLAWERGNTFLRHSPLMEALIAGMGFTDATVDQLFIAAAAKTT
jgi:hypothetical protein